MKGKNSPVLHENISTLPNSHTDTELEQHNKTTQIISYMIGFKIMYVAFLIMEQLLKRELNITATCILISILIIMLITCLMFYYQYIDNSLTFWIFIIMSISSKMIEQLEWLVNRLFNMQLLHQD